MENEKQGQIPKNSSIVTTIRLGLKAVNASDLDEIKRLMREQRAALRYAYNRFMDGEDGNLVYHSLSGRFQNLDSYEANSIRNEASGVIRSQQELLPMEREKVAKRIESAEERVTKYEKRIGWAKKRVAELAANKVLNSEKIAREEKK